MHSYYPSDRLAVQLISKLFRKKRTLRQKASCSRITIKGGLSYDMKIYTRKADKANVLEMKTQGKNYTEIAEELKLSKQ